MTTYLNIDTRIHSWINANHPGGGITEPLELVFKYLPLHTLRPASLVCRSWKAYTDKEVYRRCVLTGNQFIVDLNALLTDKFAQEEQLAIIADNDYEEPNTEKILVNHADGKCELISATEESDLLEESKGKTILDMQSDLRSHAKDLSELKDQPKEKVLEKTIELMETFSHSLTLHRIFTVNQLFLRTRFGENTQKHATDLFPSAFKAYSVISMWNKCFERIENNKQFEPTLLYYSHRLIEAKLYRLSLAAYKNMKTETSIPSRSLAIFLKTLIEKLTSINLFKNVLLDCWIEAYYLEEFGDIYKVMKKISAKLRSPFIPDSDSYWDLIAKRLWDYFDNEKNFMDFFITQTQTVWSSQLKSACWRLLTEISCQGTNSRIAKRRSSSALG